CGEETKALAFREVFRTVVTDVEFGKIFVLQRIGSSGGYTLTAIGERSDSRSGVPIDIIALIVHEHTAYPVVAAELTVIDELCFHLLSPVADQGAAVTEEFCAHVVLLEHQLSSFRVAALNGIGGGGFPTLDSRTVVGIERECKLEFKSFGDSFEVLVERNLAHELVAELGVKTRSHQTFQRVFLTHLSRSPPSVDIVAVYALTDWYPHGVGDGSCQVSPVKKFSRCRIGSSVNVASHTRRMQVGQAPPDFQIHHCGFSEADIDVGAEVIALQMHVAFVLRLGVVSQVTRFGHISETHEIPRDVTTPAYVDGRL